MSATKKRKLNTTEPIIVQLARDAKVTVPEMRKRIARMQRDLNQYG